MPDNVNHPAHYESGQFECIDVMLETQGAEAVKDFCICNAFKYLYRHRRKNGAEDIAKAKWYLDKYLEIDTEHVSNESIERTDSEFNKNDEGRRSGKSCPSGKEDIYDGQ